MKLRVPFGASLLVSLLSVVVFVQFVAGACFAEQAGNNNANQTSIGSTGVPTLTPPPPLFYTREAGARSLAEEQRSQATKTPDFLPYIKEMERDIRGRWKPSRPAHHNAKVRAVTQFNLAEDGSVSDLKISESSQDDRFDAQALQAVRDAAPLKRPPEWADGYPLTIQFIFDYEEYSHTRTQRQYQIGHPFFFGFSF